MTVFDNPITQKLEKLINEKKWADVLKFITDDYRFFDRDPVEKLEWAAEMLLEEVKSKDRRIAELERRLEHTRKVLDDYVEHDHGGT